ncbi:MAG TPA: glycosyltransferase [Phycisphaerales bacterium]|nr:glycosyltransferase [Phycisphaerales bacterium]
METLDIIVPTYRLETAPLRAILSLAPPAGVRTRWLIVIDNPCSALPPEVAAMCDRESVDVIRNERNLGSAGARNTALDRSQGEWVLFLDDDVAPAPNLLVRYEAAVARNPNATGFFGPTRFQPAQTRYQRGVEASDILTFFRLAEQACELAWAPTSNVLVRGAVARLERFRTVFPKGGGGEDIDYLLRVSRRHGGAFIAEPSAVVEHPWWFEGRRDYTRFMRWSYGDSLLHDLHPEFTYRSAPNAIEVLAVGLPVTGAIAAATGTLMPMFALAGGVVVGELLVEFSRLCALKSWRDAVFCMETVLIRSANDLGRVSMQLRLGRLHGITERWDHFCNGEHVSYHKRWSAIKFAAHLLFSGVLAAGFAALHS